MRSWVRESSFPWHGRTGCLERCAWGEFRVLRRAGRSWSWTTIRGAGGHARLLEHRGLTVLTAADGRSALEIFRRCLDEIRLVVLDLTLPTRREAVFRIMRQIRRPPRHSLQRPPCGRVHGSAVQRGLAPSFRSRSESSLPANRTDRPRSLNRHHVPSAPEDRAPERRFGAGTLGASVPRGLATQWVCRRPRMQGLRPITLA